MIYLIAILGNIFHLLFKIEKGRSDNKENFSWKYFFNRNWFGILIGLAAAAILVHILYEPIIEKVEIPVWSFRAILFSMGWSSSSLLLKVTKRGSEIINNTIKK